MAAKMTPGAAVSNLDTMFGDSDSVGVNRVFLAYHRTLAEESKNKLWLANKLAAMKDYDFIIRRYATQGGKRRLVGLTLTEKGKKALGRNPEPVHATTTTTTTVPPTPAAPAQEVTPETVLKAVKQLRKQLPSFEVVFEIKPKDERGFLTQVADATRRFS